MSRSITWCQPQKGLMTSLSILVSCGHHLTSRMQGRTSVSILIPLTRNPGTVGPAAADTSETPDPWPNVCKDRKRIRGRTRSVAYSGSQRIDRLGSAPGLPRHGPFRLRDTRLLVEILDKILTGETSSDTMTLKYEAAAVNLGMTSPRTSTANVVIDPVACASQASAIPGL